MSRKKIIPSLLFIVIALGFLFFPDFVFAQGWFIDTAVSVGDAILRGASSAMLWLASKFMAITMFIIGYVIELASYNNYINSSAVELGWVLVRDVANMFFVVILMLIAFGTVLGIEQFEWKKMMFKFVVAAVLVNFSRIICGIIIDAAQVFMMTFISGVAVIGGQNLINALKMSEILKLAQDYNPTKGVQEAQLFPAALTAMIFAFATMVIIGAYLAVILGRLVALWVLIILSPLAYILNVIPKFASYAQEWWKEFTNYVIVGPILAFFLWLAFAVAGGGNAYETDFGAGNSAYPMKNVQAEMGKISSNEELSSVTTGVELNQILEMGNLANFLIATALLLVGVNISRRLAGIASGALGTASGMVSGFAGYASGLSAARWTAGAGRKLAAWGVKKGLKKAPLVGGDVWKRHAQGIKAKTSMYVDKKLMKREAKSRERSKRGGFGKVTGYLTQTRRQRQKKADYLTSAAKNIDAIRDESLGMGSDKTGKLAGRTAMELQLVKAESDMAKKIGLSYPKEELLREQGRHAEADLVRNERVGLELENAVRKAGSLDALKEGVRAGIIEFGVKVDGKDLDLDATLKFTQEQKINREETGRKARNIEAEAKAKVFSEKGRYDLAQTIIASVEAEEYQIRSQSYAGLDSSDKVLIGKNLVKRRDEAKTPEQKLNAAYDLMSFAASNMHDSIAMDSLKDISLANYTGTRSTEDSKKLVISMLSGMDANDPAKHPDLDKFIKELEQRPGAQGLFRNFAINAQRAATERGDLTWATAIESGANKNNFDQLEIIRGFETNKGNYDERGVKRTDAQKQQRTPFAVDQNRVANLTSQRIDFSRMYDTKAVYTSGNTIDQNYLNGISKAISNKTNQQILNAAPMQLIENLIKDTASGAGVSDVELQRAIEALNSSILDSSAQNKFMDAVKSLATSYGLNLEKKVEEAAQEAEEEAQQVFSFYHNKTKK